MWPEIEKIINENRHELQLNGKVISERIKNDGLDPNIFTLKNLNYLNIHDTHLNGISDDIKNLENLQNLVLHTNHLEMIPDSVGELKKLKILDLSQNQLIQIPKSINELTQLTTLNLSYNRLDSIPEFTKLNRLSVLNLTNNCLEQFPALDFVRLVNLSELKLSDNKIQTIPHNIEKSITLKSLDLNGNQIKDIPGELGNCQKLKDLNLKNNPITDRRLFKLIEQGKNKQIIDYIKANCPRKPDNVEEQVPVVEQLKKLEIIYKYKIKVFKSMDNFRIIVTDDVKNVREYCVGCIVKNFNLTKENYKKFIQLQNKLHETVCSKRTLATIATHDFNKLSSQNGKLIYTTRLPTELIIQPLNHTNKMSGKDLVSKLQGEAEKLRKEKKRNTYSGIHKYLSLIDGKPSYPCLLDGDGDVISFPPITNSEKTKISPETTVMFIEITSSTSYHICKTAMDNLLKDMVIMNGADLDVTQVKCENDDGLLKIIYPSKNDLIFNDNLSINVERE